MSLGKLRLLTCLVYWKELNDGAKLADVHIIGPIEFGIEDRIEEYPADVEPSNVASELQMVRSGIKL